MNAFFVQVSRSGGLVRYVPQFMDDDDSEVRCILLRPDVATRLAQPSDDLEERLWIGIHAQMTAYVRGDLLSISYPGSQGPNGDVKGLAPATGPHWQMRFRTQTQYRLLGVVPEKDVFVGTLLLPRPGLDFHAATRRSTQIWNSLPTAGKPTLISSAHPDHAFTHWREAS